jgi:hypothetical protein
MAQCIDSRHSCCHHGLLGNATHSFCLFTVVATTPTWATSFILPPHSCCHLTHSATSHLTRFPHLETAADGNCFVAKSMYLKAMVLCLCDALMIGHMSRRQLLIAFEWLQARLSLPTSSGWAARRRRSGLSSPLQPSTSAWPAPCNLTRTYTASKATSCHTVYALQ